MSEQRARTEAELCTNCGQANKEGARFCSACGWLLESRPQPQRLTLFESGRTLVLDALQQKHIEEACKFLDRQVQAGAHLLDQQIRLGARKLSDASLPQKAQEQIRSLTVEFRSWLSRQPKPEAVPLPQSPEAQGVECSRCGAVSRPQSRFCLYCGDELAGKPPRLDLSFAVEHASHVGLARELNEDRVHAWPAVVAGQIAWLCVLADGMGGENAGEVASQAVMDTAAEQWRGVIARQPLTDNARFLSEIVQEANRRIYVASQLSPEQRGMGTTATLALVREGCVHVAHVGDSRAYLLNRAGAAQRITRDHSLVEVLVSIGQITPEEAQSHPQRNLLYRSVGREATIEVDTFVRRLEPDDHLLLCSDGLTLHLADEQIAAAIKQRGTIGDACRRLIALANEQGGEDNTSVLLVQVSDSPKPAEGGAANGWQQPAIGTVV